MVGGRCPKMGEETLEILSEEAIRVYLMYYDPLKDLFTQYIHTNFNSKKKV
jgi:predicted Fe-Mo cluster-binding NifX family protein